MVRKNAELFEDIQHLLETYCEGCFLFNHHAKEQGRRFAHSFCIKKCSVGQQLKEIGKKLS